MDVSKYNTNDMWDWFFTNKITKEGEADRQFRAKYGIKTTPEIKAILGNQLKAYNRRLAVQKQQKGELKKLCPCPSNGDQLLIEGIQMQKDEDEDDDSSSGEEDEGPSAEKKKKGCYKPFASLKSSNQLVVNSYNLYPLISIILNYMHKL